MTVNEAIQKANKNRKDNISVLVDARDILDILEYVNEDKAYERKIELAIHEIGNMNIESPYSLKLINDMGNIEEYQPIEGE